MMSPEIISNEEYHSRPYMSATKLKHFLKSPAHYKAAMEAEDSDTPAFRLGRMVHTYVLEGPSVFSGQYSLFEGDRRTKAGKDSWAEMLASGREPIKRDEMDICHGISEAVTDLIPAGESELSYDAEICGVKCQCRVDRITDDGWVYDLKTCQDVTAVDRVFYSYQYDVQAVFYEMVLAACGGNVKGMRFVFVEKTPPFDVAVREIDPAIRPAVAEQIVDALRRYRQCVESGKWPGVEGVDPAVKIAPAPAWRVSGIVDVDLSGFYSDENEAC